MQKQEFLFEERDFERIQDLLKEQTGIALAKDKRQLVYGRLVRRLRALGQTSFHSYIESLSSDTAELRECINALTTNVTAFFRENHHFEYLADTLLPWIYQHKPQGKRMRIWSAGCSSGQEPYSIAMVLQENPPTEPGWDIKILATDLDTNVVAHGKAGKYHEDRVTGISDQRLRRFFQKGTEENAGYLRANSSLRELITFKSLNLMHAWPMRGPFDLIFCRNVIIYFDRTTRNNLARRYHQLLSNEGVLIIGHSESLADLGDVFVSRGRTVYERIHSMSRAA